jgi:GDP/UDP-N,N'-diacetylbacillosamine 2-epimerase (hydrolysing)
MGRYSLRKKIKICVIGSSRATYGYKKNILKILSKDKDFDLKFIVTGMHLSRKHGYSVRDIISDKIPIYKKINTNFESDNEKKHIFSLSKEMINLSISFDKIKPDIVLVTGDRAEMFMAALTAAYMKIAVAHIQSGDLSGHIDGSIRHAITKISHLHFASCEDSKNRVLKMGEEKWRVFNTGAPQLDDFYRPNKIKISDFNKKFKIKIQKNFLIVMQHPVLYENVDAGSQIEKTLIALENLSIQKIVIYPNIDTGNNKIIKIIEKYKNKKNFNIFKNLNRDYFIFLLRNANMLIGNSSCGILEAASFKLPVINIGSRQKGRLQSKNIINTGYSIKEIKKAIKIIQTSKNYKKNLSKCINLYGDGKSSRRIVNILKKIKYDRTLLDKTNSY